MSDHSQRPMVFLDFDGTISRADVVDAILERYAAPEWLRVEEEWRAGRIGSRECLRRQMALVAASPDELDALIDGIGIDDGFVPLLEACAGRDLPVHVVSDGFDYCIRRLLRQSPAAAQHMVQAVGVSASHLEPAGGGAWRTAFQFPEAPCVHGCATCKPSVMREIAGEGRPIVFVGDGLSDRHAVAAADLVYAKDKLAEYCVARDIAHVPFGGLFEVAADLKERLRGGESSMRRAAARVIA